MTAPSLPEFILARVAEDEAAALEVGRARFGWASVDFNSMECANHGHQQRPMRVLRQCEAIRRIVDLYLILDVSNLTTENERAQHSTLRWVCREYAAIWSDHPDYRAEWAA